MDSNATRADPRGPRDDRTAADTHRIRIRRSPHGSVAARIVVLGSEVDDAVANRVTAQLLLLSAEDRRADISLYINSPGGAVSPGLAVYDTIQLIPNDVSTVAVGFAASMGQVLLCAGAKGKRFSLPNARIMMRQPSDRRRHRRASREPRALEAADAQDHR